MGLLDDKYKQSLKDKYGVDRLEVADAPKTICIENDKPTTPSVHEVDFRAQRIAKYGIDRLHVEGLGRFEPETLHDRITEHDRAQVKENKTMLRAVATEYQGKPLKLWFTISR